MKKLALVTLLLIAAVGAQAQGYVNFANIGAGVNQPMRNTVGTAAPVLIAGTGIYVELLAGSTADVSSMSPVGAMFMGSFANGYFNGGSRNVTTVTGTSAFAAIRAWSTQGGTLTSWSAGNVVGNQAGITAPFAITLQPSSTLPPAVMTGMPGLTLTTVVPEPATLVLGALGLAGLLCIRRRK